MVDNKTLALELSAKILFQPTDDKLLVKPLKPTMITKLVPVAPNQTFNGVDEAEASEPTAPSKQKVEANIAKGIILKLGTDIIKNNPEGYEVGDVVYYPKMAGMNFELLKDSRLLRRYEIVAIQKG
jgi:co-chaperonin GroES (HSP10)